LKALRLALFFAGLILVTVGNWKTGHLFRKACEFGLEGLVSKRKDRPLSLRTVEGLDQNEEPLAPRNGAGERVVLIRSPIR
jgi:hypothetical protein